MAPVGLGDDDEVAAGLRPCVLDLLGRRVLHARHVAGGPNRAVQQIAHFVAVQGVVLHITVAETAWVGLHDQLAEQALARGRHQVQATTHGASRFAPQRHTAGVTTKGRDVLLHPLHGSDLVLETLVARHRGARDEPSERAQAVVSGDSDDVLGTNDVVGVVHAEWALGVALDERTTVEEQHHGKLGGGVGPSRAKHIQEQAVLALDLRHIGVVAGLHATRAVRGGVERCGPGLHGLRWHEPILTSGGRGVRDAQPVLGVSHLGA
mmetsp:Transcript_56003/g.114018  ORF Transcript_56003/g.114018 Transcript_56003/m.114018 type:complete len:265 (+) Transcript_56003:790-1584(+)